MKFITLLSALCLCDAIRPGWVSDHWFLSLLLGVSLYLDIASDWNKS